METLTIIAVLLLWALILAVMITALFPPRFGWPPEGWYDECAICGHEYNTHGPVNCGGEDFEGCDCPEFKSITKGKQRK